ncbi:hypothetical protein HY441_01165 [Candidatus Microgenomates bacterium]|nr:hypothetical protein [Candidatus Microgenomates bacterium]
MIKEPIGTGWLLIVILAPGLLAASIIFGQSSGCQKFEAGQCAELKWKKTDARSGEVAEIAISPTDPDVMYAGIEVNSHSLYKSTDGGNSWRRFDGPGDHTKDVAVSPQDANKAYVAMSESVHTTDLSISPTSRSMFDRGPRREGGETQTVLSSGKPPGPAARSFSSFEIFEKNDDTIYAALKGGSTGPFGPGEKPVLYKTTNAGTTWEQGEPNLKTVNVLAIHPQDANKIFIGSDDGIYSTTDLARTLTKLNATSRVISLEVDVKNPNIIYAASEKMALKSSDGGASWQDITGPLKTISRLRPARTNPEIIYASTLNGVFKSTDGGNSWQDKSGGLKSKNLQTVTVHPTNPDIAYVGHSSFWSSARQEDRWHVGLLAHQGIFKTTDGGNTWQRSDQGIEEYNFEEIATNPSRPNEAWFASPASRGGYQTEDAAHHWRQSQTPTLHYPMRIKYSWQNPDKLFATGWQNGGPFSISPDGGVSWKLVSEQAFFKGLNRGQDLYQPKGQQSQIHLHGLAVDPTNDQVIYAGSIYDADNPVGFPLDGAHLWKSTDGGNSWQESDEGFPHATHTAIHDLVVDPKNAQVIYAATTHHESEAGIGIYKSSDGGASWQAINSGLGNLNVSTIIVNPNNTNQLVAATGGGLYRSIDGGASWRQTTNPHAFDVEYVIEQPSTLYASTDEGVLKSNDFGNSWYQVNFGLPAGEGQGIGVDRTGNVIYAAVKDQGIFAARLIDVAPIDPVSEISGRGRGGPDITQIAKQWQQLIPLLIILLVLQTLISVTAAVHTHRKHFRHKP